MATPFSLRLRLHYKGAHAGSVKCREEFRCIPDFGLMAVIFGGHITLASGGLMMAGSGGLPTVGNFGLIMVTYMVHQKRCPG